MNSVKTAPGDLVAARNSDALGTFVGETRRVGRHAACDALVVAPKNEPQTRQLWVNPDYWNYRGAWRDAFPDAPIPKGFDIDHIHNKDRAAKEGWGYVRLACIPATANRRIGARHEGRNTSLFYVTDKPVRAMDFGQWSKLNTSGRFDGYE